MLELQAEAVTLSYLSDDDPGYRYASAPAHSADLPLSFRALWLRTGQISLASAGHPGGDEVTEVDEVEELCRFMGLAPACYEEFRFYTHYGIGIDVEWLPLPEEAMECSSGGFGSLQAGAKAMQRVSTAHGLAVSVSDDETHLIVVRSSSPAVS